MRKSIGILLLSFVFVLACTTQKVSDVDHPLTTINSAIESAMTMGIQKYSDNHREFYSKPFLVKQDEKLAKQGYRSRGLAVVTVLGDQRPYDIEAVVSIEMGRVPKNGRLKDVEYSFDHYDKDLATKLLKNILSLIEKRSDKNLFDDFRPF